MNTQRHTNHSHWCYVCTLLFSVFLLYFHSFPFLCFCSKYKCTNNRKHHSIAQATKFLKHLLERFGVICSNLANVCESYYNSYYIQYRTNPQLPFNVEYITKREDSIFFLFLTFFYRVLLVHCCCWCYFDCGVLPWCWVLCVCCMYNTHEESLSILLLVRSFVHSFLLFCCAVLCYVYFVRIVSVSLYDTRYPKAEQYSTSKQLIFFCWAHTKTHISKCCCSILLWWEPQYLMIIFVRVHTLRTFFWFLYISVNKWQFSCDTIG